jgi:hypothetical protein
MRSGHPAQLTTDPAMITVNGIRAESSTSRAVSRTWPIRSPPGAGADEAQISQSTSRSAVLICRELRGRADLPPGRPQPSVTEIQEPVLGHSRYAEDAGGARWNDAFVIIKERAVELVDALLVMNRQAHPALPELAVSGVKEHTVVRPIVLVVTAVVQNR